MFLNKIILLSILSFFGCVYDGNKSEFRTVSEQDYIPTSYTRVRIKDSIYQDSVFSNISAIKFFFLNHIPYPVEEPTEKWKNQTLRFLISSDENLMNTYQNSFKFEKIQDVYSELKLIPSETHLTNSFEDNTIFIFLMMDHQSRYHFFKRSMIGFPLIVALRVSIFKNNQQIAFCQQIVKKNTFTNEFLETELGDKNSIFYQLQKDNRIGLKTGNLLTDQISVCLEKLKIKNQP
ncbi:hypothetical protein EHQ16_03975 [Leptospira kanakyensis]|uniref:Lipoprotein n=1 Tax=Leptospira kanakyensis TaxID=2484968 RepID=A0A6N4PZI7_9LEPT|nr:hypothetical protein [Leptospira kanakyensis]TGK50785.1 hypothetical protein EHQ11_14045 [Leptospira kanakyensis]TGK63614.1 hypothetical protein EHQ16_03975 [Leptospira kanakyensis]TGK69922.1 hypothetical protein EHQ18_14205 [Leptospira kanakyensis]